MWSSPSIQSPRCFVTRPWRTSNRTVWGGRLSSRHAIFLARLGGDWRSRSGHSAGELAEHGGGGFANHATRCRAYWRVVAPSDASFEDRLGAGQMRPRPKADWSRESDAEGVARLDWSLAERLRSVCVRCRRRRCPRRGVEQVSGFHPCGMWGASIQTISRLPSERRRRHSSRGRAVGEVADGHHRRDAARRDGVWRNCRTD